MNLSVDQIIAIYESPLTSGCMKRYLTKCGIGLPSSGEAIKVLDEDALALHHDAASDALMNDAPIVESYDAEVDKGVFPIHIQGIRGAYVVRAQEFDDSPPLRTLEDAREYLQLHYGEMLVAE